MVGVRGFEPPASSVPLQGTLGEAYLERRACHVPNADGDVRFHPRLLYTKESRTLPAIVCRVSTVVGNRSVGVHPLFLDPLGSDRAVAKMRLGGCDEPVCIRLFHDEDVLYGLGIAEGVETALAAARLHRPVWATIDAGQMEQFPLIEGIERPEPSLPTMTPQGRGRRGPAPNAWIMPSVKWSPLHLRAPARTPTT